MKNIFTARDIPEDSVVANLRSQNDFYNYHNPKSVRFGTETLRTLGPKIWNFIPTEIKNISSLSSFKDTVRKWIPVNCPCRLCQNYIEGVGFI